MSFDLVKFNAQVYTAMTETVDQQVNLFNEATRGAITLAPSNANVGDFSMVASFQEIKNLVRRRDVNNGTNTIQQARLKQLSNVSVKVASGTPEIVFEPAQYEWIKQDPETAAVVIAEQLAPAMLQDQLNSALAALVSAMTGNADVVNNVTTATDKTASLSNIAATSAKFGDRSTSLVAWVVHSKTMHDIWGEAIKNGQQLFKYESINVTEDPFGRIFVMTDSPALYVPAKSEEPATPAYYYSLGLVPQAALVQPNNDFYATMVEKTGTENIQRLYQAEWSYNLGLCGYTWDTANGGSSPSNVSIGTSSNWDKTAASNKDTAGVMMKSE